MIFSENRYRLFGIMLEGMSGRKGDGGARKRAAAICRPSSDYELLSMCARSSAIEPNLTVPSGSLASIDPSV